MSWKCALHKAQKIQSLAWEMLHKTTQKVTLRIFYLLPKENLRSFGENRAFPMQGNLKTSTK